MNLSSPIEDQLGTYLYILPIYALLRLAGAKQVGVVGGLVERRKQPLELEITGDVGLLVQYGYGASSDT